ncbi:hypothetical protein ATCV1_z454L [Acanthocystis turfacea chlorella virus 1]|uniref:Uncharacterized protein z454L n=1 Tax=Chlorovirus heliozoae TaxID=322019 RepID=A7K964_9PHYC|nr:hypothetical protein ATCV1_z454L [Acanthocystis turfacea chlorella virus 1]ABT16588.1 hypothetical protein ATCV1_z454L [Acanthocystis turfacea chlorella virus 1]
MTDAQGFLATRLQVVCEYHHAPLSDVRVKPVQNNNACCGLVALCQQILKVFVDMVHIARLHTNLGHQELHECRGPGTTWCGQKGNIGLPVEEPLLQRVHTLAK